MNLFGKILAVVSSAGLFTLCFPPNDHRSLAWVCLVPFLYVVRRSGLREAVMLAGLWGMAAAYGVTDWLPPTIALYYEQPLWLGLSIFLAAAALMGAADYMLFGAYYWWLGRRNHRALTISAAAAWVAAELGRARLWSGNPWGLMGYSQVGLIDTGSPLAGIVQTADVWGVYGLSFLLVLVNLSLTETLVAAVERTGRRRAMLSIAVSLALVVAASLYGDLRTSRAVAENEEEHVMASVVQGNLDLGSRWDPSYYGRNLQAYLALTRQTVEAAEPRLVVWPENAMTFFVADEPAYRRTISTVTEPANVELLAGAPRVRGRNPAKYFNSAFVLSPQGEIRAYYDKEHLLPFSEYMPLRSFDLIQRSFGKVREFTAGDSIDPLPTVAGMAGVVICNEVMFPRIVSERVRVGADYIVNLANDSWIQDQEFAEHQFSIARLRAIENRRFLVRASTSGPSAVVDASGAIVAAAPPLSEATISARIAPLSTRSFYARFGDLFAFICLAWVALSAVGTMVRGRRR